MKRPALKLTKAARSMRYGGLGVPRKVPDGRVLAHNHVRHTIDMPNGANGFRWWTWPKGQQRGFLRCNCGWSGLPHYAARDVAKSYRCDSPRALMAGLQRLMKALAKERTASA